MINKDRLKTICADIGVDLDAQGSKDSSFLRRCSSKKTRCSISLP